MSTPQAGGSNRRPGSAPLAGKSPASGAAKPPGAKPSADGPGGGGGKGGKRPPIPAMRVSAQRNWMPIIIAGVAGLLAITIIGYAAWQVHQNGKGWQAKADSISGITDYRKTNPDILAYTSHEFGPLKYPTAPPVGGAHNPNWQRCLGDIYPAAIANENAVHSMEHGAIWITYRPDLPANQVATLAAKVRGNDFMLMSPYPGQDKPISVQTWGFQLKVDNASDSRIGEFITTLREVSSAEPGSVCSAGSYITATGTTAHDLGKPDPTPSSSGSLPPSNPVSPSPMSSRS